MSEWSSKFSGSITDGHVHMGPISSEGRILAIREASGINKIGLVSIQDPKTGMGLPQSLYMKAKHPDVFYVFAGLNHGAKLSDGKAVTRSLADQLDDFAEMGCDGIKMIEGKPTSRQIMDIPVTDAYFADYWARVEELALPIVWHVNDPEEFWKPETLPAWARERNWGYGPDDVQKETLYAEVDEVLEKYPDLNIIFAHFYFLSADLPRASRFMDAHPRVCFDLTPGIEMLYNMSHDVDATRDFFLKYADRIVYGTDIASRNTLEEGKARAGIIYRWLESEDTFRVPETVDFLLGKPEDGIIRGLALPDDVLQSIYRGNFVRLAGATPKKQDLGQVISACTRLASIAQVMSGTPAENTGPIQVVHALEQLA